MGRVERETDKEAQGITRREELETWLRGGPEADANFYSWWELKQARKKSAMRTKAIRGS